MRTTIGSFDQRLLELLQAESRQTGEVVDQEHEKPITDDGISPRYSLECK